MYRSTKKLSKEEFIEKARQLHGDKYDYAEVNYVNNKTKVCIICPVHGKFWQTPSAHLSSKHPQGCPLCGGTQRLSLELFVEKSRAVHGDRYDYAKVDYKNNRTKVCIVCPEHGEFWQTPDCHLSGQGCPKCAILETNKKNTYTQDEFIARAVKKHGNKYDYSKVNYINSQLKVCIVCPDHGEFWQTPAMHLSGQGCPKCATIERAKHKTMTHEMFLEKCRNLKILDKIEFLSEYTFRRDKIKCRCKRCGFSWEASAGSILQGSECPICNHFGGKQQHNLYLMIKEKFPDEVVLENYHNYELLGHLEIDIFLPEHKIAIEYQGAQHFHPVEIMGGAPAFGEIIERDLRKYSLLKENGILPLYCYSSSFADNGFDIYHHKNSYTHFDRLLCRISKEIKKGGNN